ncbi:penicillin-binding protein [Shewanella sp. S1-49-MNA-CIBAN-0167]|uniref:penicillin-binding protein n=1 Tax=Shewanella sp. S1-49-MNA-CIBAN-0167 TaxID=3140468 RepID=UPI00332AF92C
MSEKMNGPALNALKIAFTYMPKSIEVTKYEYGDDYKKILDHIETVREMLLINMPMHLSQFWPILIV